MATEGMTMRDGHCLAGADLSALQFTAVKLSAVADKTVLAASDNLNIYGILQNKPTSGDTADVVMRGVCKAKFGGTIAAGDSLDVVGGVLVTHAAGKIVAVALEAGAINEIHEVNVLGQVT